MKERFYFFSVTVLAIVSVAIIGHMLMQNPQPVHAQAGHHQWEYMTIARSFCWEDAKIKDKNCRWYINGKEVQPEKGGMDKALSEMGADGWELVSITPYSLNMEYGTYSPAFASGYQWAQNGVSTQDVWVFKRPK